MITVAQVRSASRYKGFIEQKYNPLFGRLRVAAGEEGGKLAVNDHWEDEHRAHEAGRTWTLARAMLPLTPDMVP